MRETESQKHSREQNNGNKISGTIYKEWKEIAFRSCYSLADRGDDATWSDRTTERQNDRTTERQNDIRETKTILGFMKKGLNDIHNNAVDDVKSF